MPYEFVKLDICWWVYWYGSYPETCCNIDTDLKTRIVEGGIILWASSLFMLKVFFWYTRIIDSLIDGKNIAPPIIFIIHFAACLLTWDILKYFNDELDSTKIKLLEVIFCRFILMSSVRLSVCFFDHRCLLISSFSIWWVTAENPYSYCSARMMKVKLSCLMFCIPCFPWGEITVEVLFANWLFAINFYDKIVLYSDNMIVVNLTILVC